MCKVLQFVNTLFHSNTYVLYLEDRPEVWLVDCGDVEPLIQWCEKYGKSIEGVFLTHTHFDHIYGLSDLLVYIPHVKVYTSSNGVQGLASPRYNLSLFHEKPFEYTGDVNTLEEGCSIDLYPNVCLTPYFTPGHDWSCLVFLVDDYLFTGDSYIPSVKLVTNFPKSNKEQAKESLNRILDLSKKCSILCPGHGEILKL